MDWAAVIRAVSPRARASIVEGLAEAMPTIVERYAINTKLRQAHFLAQCAHESDGFTTTVEYASGDAYDTRTDLGFTAARDGDGRRFKGFGLIQTTGPNNQRDAARALGILDQWNKDPRILSRFPYAALAAGYYWSTRPHNAAADADDLRRVTKLVNGGYNGLKDRAVYLERAKQALGIGKSKTDDGNDPMPREQIKILQQQLMKRGYTMVGLIDGKIGGNTVAAITAFQHDQGLPITGSFDLVTRERLMASADKRPIPAERAQGEPENSRIVKDSSVLETAGKIGTGVVVIGKSIETLDPMSALDEAGKISEQLQGIIEPIRSLLTYASGNTWILILIACAAIWYVARRIRQNRIQDFQTGKTAS